MGKPSFDQFVDDLASSIASRYVRVRRPGGKTVSEFSREKNIGQSSAKAALETARRNGEMTLEKHVIDPKTGRSCYVYYPVAKRKNKA